MQVTRVFYSAAVVVLALSGIASAAGQAPATEDGGADAKEAPAPVVEITVRGSRADQLRQSAQAVTVVDLERARRSSADLGEVLARTEGVSVQRSGGLGSPSRFSLAGFEREQVRFFLDGIPLAAAGFPFGFENVPVNLVERVEVYRGVVPIRFGADALGGAVQLVSRRPMRGTHGNASYQASSFDTHRITLSVSQLDEPSGLYAQATGFVDRTRNDYAVDAPVVGPMGVPGQAKVRRFHDAYAADGAVLELGVLERKWADRLSVRGFYGRQERDLQSDLVMVQSYGEATAGVVSGGSTLSYKQTLFDDATLEVVGNYAYTESHIKDLTRCVYDWFGRCVNTRARPGEISGLTSREPYLYEHTTLLRANLTVPFREHHTVALSLSPTANVRSGEDRSPEFPGTRDPLDVHQQLYGLTSGASYQLQTWAERLEAEAFFKQYSQFVRAERSVPLGLEQVDKNRNRVGAGTMARYRVTDWLLSKASYEWATRLPTPEELLGNGIDISPNVDLRPEVSHNLNLELAFSAESARTGSYLLELVGFYRLPEDLISRQTASLFSAYVNIADTTVRGGQSRARWIAPRNLLTIDGNLTYQDVRNQSDDGPFATFRGDRVPNRPFLFGTATARIELAGLFAPRDQVWLSFITRCTGEFDRGWASVGKNRSVVPRQVQHTVGLTYTARGQGRKSLSSTLEVQNLSDEKTFDFFGAQRPGRAVLAKLVAEM